MTASLALSVETEVFESLRADLVAAAFFAGDRPLRGDAGRADWRLCGLVSDLLRDGHLAGAAGEAALVASARGLRSPRLLLLGLGERAELDEEQVESAAREAVGRAVRLGCRSLALSPPGAFAGMLQPDRVLEASLAGALAGLADGRAALELALRVPSAEAARTRAALEHAVRASTRGGVRVRLAPPDLPRSRPSAGQDGP